MIYDEIEELMIEAASEQDFGTAVILQTMLLSKKLNKLNELAYHCAKYSQGLTKEIEKIKIDNLAKYN